MKELAILVPTIKWAFLVKEYRNYEYEKDDISIQWMMNIKDQVIDTVFSGGKKPDRIYFGNEFCERLLWTSGHVIKMAGLCAEENMKLSLVTPYCSDHALDHISTVLRECADLEIIDEIIVNDWGMLYRLKEQFPKYRRVLGRVLDKMKRDPRLSRKDFHSHFSADGLRMLQSPTASSAEFRAFMTEQGVEHFEIDNVSQGLYLEDVTDKHISVYLPYGFVTNSKICQFAGIHNEPSEKFQVGTPCRKECQSLMQFMHKHLSAFPSDNDDMLDQVRVIRKGNTVFFINKDISQCMKDAHIDRIIYEPVVPM